VFGVRSMQYSITLPRTDIWAGKYGQGKCMQGLGASERQSRSYLFVQLHFDDDGKSLPINGC
jgi:hypothetical protein